jgi:large subunit ribosomal protein L13
MFTKKDLNKTLRVAPKTLNAQKKWIKLDAIKEGTLGRLAVKIASLLIGKNKASYNDFRDAGDFVIVENVAQAAVTGSKMTEKMYYTYSGYKGNVKSMTMRELLAKHPEKVLWYAVRGMLPRNKLRDLRMKRLKLFPHTSTSYDHLIK